MKIIVYHAMYGCETGCCGHVVSIDGNKTGFYFDHPGRQDPRLFAEELVREVHGDEHVKDLDWDNCRIIDD